MPRTKSHSIEIQQTTHTELLYLLNEIEVARAANNDSELIHHLNNIEQITRLIPANDVHHITGTIRKLFDRPDETHIIRDEMRLDALMEALRIRLSEFNIK